VRVTKKVYRR